MATNGVLRGSPRFATFVSAARWSDVLALLNEVLNPEDFD